jgi:hypothetical protein
VTHQVIEKYCGPPRVITKTPTGISAFQRRSSSESSGSAKSSKSVRLNTQPIAKPDFEFKHPPKGGDPDRKKNVLIVDPDSGQKLVLKVRYPRTVSCLLRVAGVLDTAWLIILCHKSATRPFTLIQGRILLLQF